MKFGSTVTDILRANAGRLVGALKKILGARTKRGVSSLHWRAAGLLRAPQAAIRCACADEKSTDGARLALDQTRDVGVLYTDFSGLMQKFIKNNSKPAKTHDSSQALRRFQRQDLAYAGNF
ncbi:hypothetical protein [Massilia antarctica]|uniref:hypothetical protein n=1 Tax=Massilia antarctica TaxID=2765360 RepID=UPI0011AF01B5|nr:hypothetical protein [Massilia sp. H27-R4]MCY0914100.1 hypothetical protein [Massilia sp. H27-R4]